MCDSMDGRVVDPSAPLSKLVATPTFDALASDGVNFVRTYASSPQCVPSRASMLSGRRTDQIRAFSNDNGLALSPGGEPDEACVSAYGEAWCRTHGASQALETTLFDELRSGGYEVALFGKVDIGAGVLRRFGPAPTQDGYHGGASLPIVTRAADVRRPTKPNPLELVDDHAAHVHPEDWKVHDRCSEWLRAKGDASRSSGGGGGPPWFLYCSLNIPHPAFRTNATWLHAVDEAAVRASPPAWPAEGSMHPYDAYMTTSKAVGDDQPVFGEVGVFRVRRTYLAMVAEADYLIGQVVEAAREAKLYRGALVASLRVPLLLAGGALPVGPRFRRGAVATSLASLLDIFPTIAEAAQLRPLRKGALAGEPLLPLPRNTRSRLKYVAFGRDRDRDRVPWQLFDLESDPAEVTNLARTRPEEVARLDALLRAELGSGENRLSPDGDPDAIDAAAKRLQQATFLEHFAPCVANEAPLDAAAAEAFFARGEAQASPLDDSAARGGRTPLRQLLERAYTGFDEDDWRKVQWWAAQDIQPPFEARG
ncbi:hypothetical protein EMIHUDRAFT_215536 [Emiliania huxleyi CCMP1516]|uniref:Sulfatase N-terminal domain-containing protein n=2 Tax=Emiliania huxleyi TaxID=2903 RepID=A0A0D3IHJ3_EMIH1|nr:hypothetical protein EMIHUDRAFT_215536 [Emiliania huxleyi CCMP1516]EOD10728.1 hypothetical protein EMIHUDRAFT_215536 [Emiliania huxleyi CCMP1516]|eukprot:XP_005763157.1 hypothetical protein EMIHUDRAFT_215536 [Emiliania huxleyi CCMP1516]